MRKNRTWTGRETMWLALAGAGVAVGCSPVPAQSGGAGEEVESVQSAATIHFDFSAPCAAGITPQLFSGGMYGCPGSVSWANRATLCGVGRRPATAQEWVMRQNGINPLHDYWTNDNLRFQGTAASCSVSTIYGTSCAAGQPMRVCTATGADPEGNSCTWTNCALGASEFGSFGGCASNPTAGTLCVKDCADGTTEQTFANGMVGCAGKDTWDNRNAECGVGHLVANAAQWSSFRGVETVGDPPLVQPTTTTHDYWTDTNLEFTGSSTSCSATPINGLSCPVNQPMRVCTSSGTDGEGNACNWTNCGYGSSVVSAALGGCGGNTTAGAVCLPDSDVYCDASGCISAQKFAASVDAQLQNKVVGYTAVVGTHVAEYGQARTSADPPATPMANNVPFHMASISKVLTTVAALQILTFHGLSVDAFIAPYLPSDWVKGPGVVSTPTVPGITFRQLLTHSAGLLNDAMTYTEIQQQIQLGIVQASKSTPTYRNINFALFRILLPLIQATGPNPSFVDPGPAGRDITTQNYYATYMNQHVFQPLGIFDATLNGTTSPPFALYYPFPAGSATGQAPGNWTALAGGGGWNLSTAEIYRVLSSLGSDNVLLSDGQKTQMNDGCLGWDCSVMSQPGYRGKNGLLIPSGAIPGSRYEVNTFMGIFKGRLGVVILTNSDPGQNLYSVVQTAVAAAAVAHP